jgi:murein DD-endopeptidase MepM/ murein hydrolase activator NlpD
MTNQALFPIINNSTVNSDLFSSIYNNNSGSTGTDFQTLLNSIYSTSGQSSGLNSGGSMISDLTPVLLLLISKLFEANINLDSSLTMDTPQGAPVPGSITQSSHQGHVALDFGVPIGTKVHSTMSGKVIYSGWNNEGYGNLVIVENGEYKTYYAHLSSIPVKVGQNVNDGDIIGLSGNTGNSTGPHLHYEIRKNGIAVNPTTTIDSL